MEGGSPLQFHDYQLGALTCGSALGFQMASWTQMSGITAELMEVVWAWITHSCVEGCHHVFKFCSWASPHHSWWTPGWTHPPSIPHLVGFDCSLAAFNLQNSMFLSSFIFLILAYPFLLFQFQLSKLWFLVLNGLCHCFWVSIIGSLVTLTLLFISAKCPSLIFPSLFFAILKIFICTFLCDSP